MKKFIILLLFSTPFAAETISWEINQTKVFFVQNKEIPMIDIAIAFHAGSRYAKPGLANFTAQSTMLGSKFLNKEQVNAKLSIVGSEMNAFVDEELVIYHLRTLSDVPVKTISDQFHSAIFNAAFPSQEIRYQRQAILSNIAFEQDQPEEIAKGVLFKNLFPSAPKYVSSINGYTDTLENIHSSDLQQYHAKVLSQPDTSIIIVGDTTEENARQIAENLAYKSHPSAKRLEKEVLNKNNEPQSISIKPEQKQTYFLFATKIPVASTDKTFVTYLLLNEVLGGNSSSYLFQTLRDKEGLVYEIHSNIEAIDDFAILSISGQSKTNNTKNITTLLENTFNNQQIDTVLAPKRIKIAKESLKNKLLLNVGNNQSKVMSILQTVKHNHEINYDQWLIETLNKITSNDIYEALKVLHSNQFYKVYVGC